MQGLGFTGVFEGCLRCISASLGCQARPGCNVWTGVLARKASRLGFEFYSTEILTGATEICRSMTTEALLNWDHDKNPDNN